MTPDEAQWVRDNVWPRVMQKAYKDTPAFFQHCACQYGMCGACEREDCQRCVHKSYQPFPSDECSITNRKWQVLAVPGGYVHPTRTATGWHRHGAAQVWLADRRCIWSCPCPCRDGIREPQPVVLVTSGPARKPPAEGQGELFGRFEPRR